MRITVARDLCEMHGQCAFVAPEVFTLTDDDLEYNEHPPSSAEAAVHQAVKVCPQLAIGIVDEH